MFFWLNFINNYKYTGYYKYDEGMYKKYDTKTQTFCKSDISIIRENNAFTKLKKRNQIKALLNEQTNKWCFITRGAYGSPNIDGNNSTYSITFIPDATLNFNTIFSWGYICPEYSFI